MKMKLVIILVVFFNENVISQWIDPHDMNTNHRSILKQSLSNNKDVLTECSGERTQENYKIYDVYLKRFVSLLLDSASLHKTEHSNIYDGHVSLNIIQEDHKFLMEFVNLENVDLNILRKLDTVLSNSLQKSVVEKYTEALEDFVGRLYIAIFNEKTLFLLGVCFVLFIVYQLFKANFSLAYVVGYLILLVLIADFGLRYMHLKEEAEIHNMNIKNTKDCDINRMSWTEYLIFLASSRDCERKVVTPLVVFLFQVKNLIIVPLHALGTGLGGFGKEMFTNLPWGLNLVMWPIMLVLFCIVLIFLTAIFTKKSMKFNIFHLLKLEFGGRDEVLNAITGTTLEKLLDAVTHRPLIQDVGVQDRPPISQIGTPKKKVKPRELKQNLKAKKSLSEIQCSGTKDKLEVVKSNSDTNISTSVSSKGSDINSDCSSIDNAEFEFLPLNEQ